MKAEKEAVIYEIGDIIYCDKEYVLVSVLYSFNCDAECKKCHEKCISTTKILRVKNTLDAKKGQRVMIGISNRAAFFRSVFFLNFPFFVFIAFTRFAEFFLTRLEYTFICLFIFLFSIIFLKITDTIMQNTRKYQITMVKILNLK